MHFYIQKIQVYTLAKNITTDYCSNDCRYISKLPQVPLPILKYAKYNSKNKTTCRAYQIYHLFLLK